MNMAKELLKKAQGDVDALKAEEAAKDANNKAL
jgi:hypothetical protein